MKYCMSEGMLILSRLSAYRVCTRVNQIRIILFAECTDQLPASHPQRQAPCAADARLARASHRLQNVRTVLERM